MRFKYDQETRDRVVRMFAERREEESSPSSSVICSSALRS